MGESYLEAKLNLLRVNFSSLLRKKTSPYTAERFKKKQRLKELRSQIKELEEVLL